MQPLRPRRGLLDRLGKLRRHEERKRGVGSAAARRAGLDGLRGRTLDDTRHDVNLTPMELQAPNAIMPREAPQSQTKAPKMNDRIAEHEAAVRAQYNLIAEAQRLLTRYLSKEIELPTLVDNLLKLFDGPRQREVQRLSREALGEDFGNNA